MSEQEKSTNFEQQSTTIQQPGFLRRVAGEVIFSLALEASSKLHQRILTRRADPLKAHLADFTAAVVEGVAKEIRSTGRNNN